MKKNVAVSFWSGVQIAVGMLMLGVTVYVSASVLPRIRSEVDMIATRVSDSSDALRAVNASYCRSATNLFSAAENLSQVSSTLGSIGWNLKETGRSLHSNAPVLKQFNGVGNSINEIGKGLVNVSCAILAQSNIIRDYKSDGHVRTSSLLVGYSSMLDDLSVALRENATIVVYAWFVCAFGAIVALLFILNGIVLLSLAGERGWE